MIKTIDLFAGAGGLSYGFTSTGKYKIVAAAEINSSASATYIENHFDGENIIMIPNVIGFNFAMLAAKLQGVDVVIGGPPCQGFSNANRQKNHIISMNNALVKEYFRAIREIRPKAFVMENVSMLSSETHRFYDSYIDHDTVSNLGVEMREDDLIISEADYNSLNLYEIISNEQQDGYKITAELLQLLNVLYKNRNNEERLGKYIDNKSELIERSIQRENKNVKVHFPILSLINNTIKTDELNQHFDDLGRFIKFQKSFRLVDELKNNEIIYNLYRDPTTGKIVAKVKSYSVIDYVKRILADDYKTSSGVINSLWFGVPQDRRRFIMIGVRADLVQEEIEFPKGKKDVLISVGDAISDLAKYPVCDNQNEPACIPYYDDQSELSQYAREMRKDSKGVHNHIVPKTGKKAKERFESLKEGQSFKDLESKYKDNYAVPERTQRNIYLKLKNDEPSETVINVRKSMWIHPTLNRAISVREAARLQSFPDKFIFKGTKDEQYQQVGNAVPPLMAEGIAKELLRYL